MDRALRRTLLALDAAVAATAVPGGIALALGWEERRFPGEMLIRSPFRDYRRPGVLLATVVGGSAAAAAVVLSRWPRTGGAASAVAGVVLTGWIAAEVALLEQLDPPTRAEMTYAAIGSAMTALGLAVALRR